MPAFNVFAKTRINRPLDQVKQTIGNFNTWTHWSPWLCLEADASVESHGEPSSVGHGYRWEGHKVGSGEMVWTDVEAKKFRAELSFLKPFKSKADVGFTLKEVHDGTDVEWVMDSSMPFYLFFMVNMMKGMITMDYSRGLAQLKDYIELGHVPFSMESNGVVDTPLVQYLGVSKNTPMEQMSTSMESAFVEVMQCINSKGLSSTGESLSVYNKMDIPRGHCHYTAAVPVSAEDAVSCEGLKVGEIYAGSAYKVTHTGPYRHLGNAWALAMSDVRHRKLKVSKRQKPYERYANLPQNTPENDLVTEIFIPLR